MIQLGIIVGYLALLIVLGVAANRMFRGTGRDYMLASHTIGPFLLLMSLFGTTMTGFSLVGSSGEAYVRGVGVYGLLASSSGIVHSLCFFLIGIKLWSFGKRHHYTTQIQFFRERLESDGIGLLLFPVLVVLVILYLLIGVIAAGYSIAGVTKGAFAEHGWFATAGHGVPPWLAALVVSLVVLMYVFFGGMRGTAWANTFQTLVFMVLGVVTFVVIASELGGQGGLIANLKYVSSRIPADKLAWAATGEAQGAAYLNFCSYLFIPLSIGMFPHVFQHWLTAKSAGSFKLAIVVHPIFIMIVWAPCVLVGMWAATGLIEIPANVGPNQVLGYLVGQLAGTVLSGFLTAGILAAIMSSLDSQFLCVGSMFTGDVVLHYFGRERFSDRQVVLIARGFVVAVVTVTYLLFLFVPAPRVFPLSVWVFSAFTALVPLALAAIYWRGLTRMGAYAGVLTAMGSWAYFFWQSNFATEQHLVFGLLPVVPMTLLATLALVVVSLITPGSRPSEATLQKFFPG